MEVKKTGIEGVLVIEPKVFGDERGYFFESFNAKEFKEKTGIEVSFVQDNESKSRYGVLRGMHFQLPPYTQSKLVRVVKGKVLDVVVDICKGSPTYGQHVECLLCAHDEDGARIAKEFSQTANPSPLTGKIGLQFFIPRGIAHGFVVLSETAVFQYKCDEFYHPEADGGISILDSSLGIDWRIPTEKANLSEKDTKHSLLKDFDSPFDINVPLY